MLQTESTRGLRHSSGCYGEQRLVNPTGSGPELLLQSTCTGHVGPGRSVLLKMSSYSHTKAALVPIEHDFG